MTDVERAAELERAAGVWLAFRQQTAAKYYELARNAYARTQARRAELVAQLRASGRECEIVWFDALELTHVGIVQLQREAAEISAHERFLRGVEPDCICQRHAHAR